MRTAAAEETRWRPSRPATMRSPGRARRCCSSPEPSSRITKSGSSASGRCTRASCECARASDSSAAAGSWRACIRPASRVSGPREPAAGAVAPRMPVTAESPSRAPRAGRKALGRSAAAVVSRGPRASGSRFDGIMGSWSGRAAAMVRGSRGSRRDLPLSATWAAVPSKPGAASPPPPGSSAAGSGPRDRPRPGGMSHRAAAGKSPGTGGDLTARRASPSTTAAARCPRARSARGGRRRPGRRRGPARAAPA